MSYSICAISDYKASSKSNKYKSVSFNKQCHLMASLSLKKIITTSYRSDTKLTEKEKKSSEMHLFVRELV